MDDLTFQLLGTFIAITVPLLFLAALIGNRDARRTILFLCWGMLAGMLAFALDMVLGAAEGSMQMLSFVVAPALEELCKALPLLLFLNEKWRPKDLRPMVFFAVASGIGFSVQESLYYFSVSAHEVTDVVTLTARALSTALMHAMTTGLIGVGIVQAMRRKRLGLAVCAGLLLAAAGIHIIYNALIESEFFVLALIIPYAMFVFVWLFLRKLEPESGG